MQKQLKNRELGLPYKFPFHKFLEEYGYFGDNNNSCYQCGVKIFYRTNGTGGYNMRTRKKIYCDLPIPLCTKECYNSYMCDTISEHQI